MDNKEKIIKNFDNIIGTNKFNNIDKTKFPLLIKVFEQFREDIIQTTEEYENNSNEINLHGFARLPLRHGQPHGTRKST